VPDDCEHGDEPSGSIKCQKFFGCLGLSHHEVSHEAFIILIYATCQPSENDGSAAGVMGRCTVVVR
jgi:hypothetical protein